MGRANPFPLHNCICYGNKAQLLLRRAHHATEPAPVPGYRGEMSVCAHLMLQDTCTQLCNGWTSSHTQRSRWSLVTQPGTTEETPHGEQSWRKARVGPCGETLHLSIWCLQKCKCRMLCWGHLLFCPRHACHQGILYYPNAQKNHSCP